MTPQGGTARVLMRCSCPCIAGSGVSAPMSELITTTITSVSRRLHRVSEIAYTFDVGGHLMGTVSTLVCAASLVKTGVAASAAWVHNN